ncbi:uncharacterized protein SOCE836_084860 [Sorangium cellulosum]|uniref:Uncharacterized protein n=1 Tax=Sorangium cellulosum TaxID=56 RepID=A0A4P2R061_SORCE|nr:uncharacterized protein SOCE836_084860 [Sorangium cellulosum]
MSDAIQTVFPMETERAILVWNHVYLPLSYKYDISLMVDDIVKICEDMLLMNHGTRLVHWPSNTFAAVWDIAWEPMVVSVEAQWSRVIGSTESILACRPRISISREDFLAEWKAPLDVVLVALETAGYTPKQIAELHRLKTVVAQLPQYGHLYRNDDASRG